MRKMGKNQWMKGILFALVFTLGVFAWSSDSVVSLAAGKAKVNASSAMIRKDADKNSDVVASVLKGDSLEIISSKKASDGQTWYKVYVDGEKTGYIRSDLVSVEESVSEEQSESGGNKTVVGSNNSTSTDKKEENKTETKTEVKTEVAVVNVSSTDAATAKTTDDVRVRKGAGTKFDVEGSAKKDTEVTVTGVATDSEGKNWYQVSFEQSGKTVTGFIREDFLEVLTRAEEEPVVEEEPIEEEPIEEEPAAENEDYYLKYMQNDSGEMDWYLFNNIEGSSQSLTQLLDAIEQVKNKELEEDEMVSTMRMIIIALGVVLIILFATVTILIFKLRDASYEYEEDDEEEDEEDDDEEEEEEEKSARKPLFGFKKKLMEEEEDEEDEEEDDEEEEEEEEKPARRSLFGFKKKKLVEEDDDEEEEEETLQEIPPAPPTRSPKTENKAWDSKDFLELDDDMEFEFLDL